VQLVFLLILIVLLMIMVFLRFLFFTCSGRVNLKTFDASSNMLDYVFFIAMVIQLLILAIINKQFTLEFTILRFLIKMIKRFLLKIFLLKELFYQLLIVNSSGGKTKVNIHLLVLRYMLRISGICLFIRFMQI